jgi:hypothetical protein
MTEEILIAEVEKTTEAPSTQPEPGDLPTRAIRPMLYTFEVDDSQVLWSAVPLSRSKDCHLQHGLAEVGYGQEEGLLDWFEKFRALAGDFKHEIHFQVSGPEILRRTFMVPVVPKRELESVVRRQASKNYPFPIQEGLFGWKIIDQLEWAGGPKYEVYSQALAGHWHDWLAKMLGGLQYRLTFLGSSGQQFEQLLKLHSPDFNAIDSYMIRIKADTIETGFYHRGHLEFYREVPVEALADDETVRSLQQALGDVTTITNLESSLLLNDIRIIISDALDYYYGLYGQRTIGRVFLCLPPEITAKCASFIENSIGVEVIDLCDEKRVQAHCRSAALQCGREQYFRWISVVPKRKLASSLVNVLPRRIKKTQRENVLFRAGVTLLLVVVLLLATVTGFQLISNWNQGREVERLEEEIAMIQGDAVLSTLKDYGRQIAQLTRNLAGYKKENNSALVGGLAVFSQVSREDVRLNKLRLIRRPDSKSLLVELEGEISGPDHRQEGVLFGFLTSLTAHPLVESAAVISKRSEGQFDRTRLVFNLEVRVRQ